MKRIILLTCILIITHLLVPVLGAKGFAGDVGPVETASTGYLLQTGAADLFDAPVPVARMTHDDKSGQETADTPDTTDDTDDRKGASLKDPLADPMDDAPDDSTGSDQDIAGDIWSDSLIWQGHANSVADPLNTLRPDEERAPATPDLATLKRPPRV